MLQFYLASLDTEEERRQMTDIYNEHKYVLLRYALKITGNQDMAEDAVHNTFMAVINNKEKYLSLPCRDFRRVAVVIVRNKCIDLLRAEGKYTDISFEDLENVFEPTETTVEETVIANDYYEGIRQHLDSIDLISRQILDMKYVLGMSYKEIGEELGITAKHVDTRIMRAKAKVRKSLQSDFRD